MKSYGERRDRMNISDEKIGYSSLPLAKFGNISLNDSQKGISSPQFEMRLPERNNLLAGRFQVISSYKGGMASVLICKDVHNGRLVAAKTPNKVPELFSREARLWLGLGQHPNIVRAHTIHEISGRPFLFMDFIGDSEGRSITFRHVLSENRKVFALILNTGISVVRALKYAQSIFPGFIHRDIKPENILIGKGGNVLVSDFGIGRIPKNSLKPIQDVNQMQKKQSTIFISGNTFLTKAGSFAGTFGYAAPEQYVDSSSITLKADIFSLGVILYEAFTGSLPFSPHRIQTEGLKLFKQSPEFPDSIELLPELKDIIIQMLAFAPVDRPELDSIEKYFISMGDSVLSEIEQTDRGNIMHSTPPDRTTLTNRVHSFLELNELQHATSALIDLQRRSPWNFESAYFVKRLSDKIESEKKKKQQFKKLFLSDISNPFKFIPIIVFGILFSTPLFVCFSILNLSFIKSNISLSESLVAFLLLSTLLIEKYINSRTHITPDIITIPGMFIGVGYAFLFNAIGHPVLSGSGLKSIVALILGGAVPYIGSQISKGGIGGGTIKLVAMIAGFTGLRIFPILLISIIVYILQGVFFKLLKLLPGELKWKKRILTPRLFSRHSLQISTSNALVIATWSVIIWPNIKFY